MSIAAAICWYDEPADTLQRVVASVAPLVSCVVAFDGAWLGFPHDEPHSHPRQLQALRDAARFHSLSFIDTDLGEPWISQAMKRTALYQAASEHADWILVIDADEQLEIIHPAVMRQSLARIKSKANAMSVRVMTPGSKRLGGGLTATAPGGSRWQPRLLRADPSIKVGPHSHRTLVTDDVLIQCGGEQDAELHADRRLAHVDKFQGMTIINHTHSRDAERIASKQAYGKARAVRGID